MSGKKLDIRKLIAIVVIVGWQVQILLTVYISVFVNVVDSELLQLTFNSVQSIVQLVIIFYYKDKFEPSNKD